MKKIYELNEHENQIDVAGKSLRSVLATLTPSRASVGDDPRLVKTYEDEAEAMAALAAMGESEVHYSGKTLYVTEYSVDEVIIDDDGEPIEWPGSEFSDLPETLWIDGSEYTYVKELFRAGYEMVEEEEEEEEEEEG